MMQTDAVHYPSSKLMGNNTLIRFWAPLFVELHLSRKLNVAFMVGRIRNRIVAKSF
jgi:hypothetical protein